MQVGNLVGSWSIVIGANLRPSIRRPDLRRIEQDSHKTGGLIFRAGVFADNARRARHALRGHDECP